MKEQMERKRKQLEKMNRLMNADPNDVEAQKEIEEAITQQMIDEQYNMVQENFHKTPFFSHDYQLTLLEYIK